AAAAIVTGSAAGAQPQAAPVTQAVAPSAADARLRSLYDDYARWDARESAYFEDDEGELKPADHLAHVDAQSQKRRQAYLQNALQQLNVIPEAQLSADERVNAEVFRTVLENALIEARFRTWEMPFNSDSSFWTYLNEDRGLDDADAYRRYIGRMRDIPRYFDEQIANMRAGIARGFTVPKATLNGRDKSIATFIETDLDNSPFYKAFEDMPATIPAAEQEALRKEGVAVIKQSVLPAYRKLLEFYRTEYYPKARTTISAQDLPDGDAFYRSQVREYTTTDLSPEEIHDIGLKEVERIHAAMLKTMEDSGFKGTFAEFLHFLKTDPQFVAKTPDELLGVSAYVAKRVDGVIGDHFGLLPRKRFGIIPVPDALAPFYTSGRGGLGNCMMNTYNLPVRPLYNIPVLTLHECEPGHSFQAAVAEEQKALPSFRRHIYFSGLGEGWGLYSEWLGNELGIYRTPYEKFGQLSYDMWRAARLVIDTGIHRYGWSRQQAIDYLASHTALSQHEVETEVDRYISWPGQALAYKLGELSILKMRAEAERTLGPRFDERKFHDTVLALGSVPLDVFEEQMHGWIKTQAVAR
ncbi:MAG TPA: DUF885 family protein, partial [Sphingomicrobium sp.]|nr:DUF885 family protein [Sphingomicrobium sp.]